ncbi:transketolase, partial [Acinetobacter baumannii]
DRRLDGLDTAIAEFKLHLTATAPKIATRKASEMTLDVIAAACPTLIGGSADLTGSNLTKAKVQRAVTPGDFSGRYIHYGIREHGM